MEHENRPILIVDDCKEDIFALKRVFKKIDLQNPVFTCEDGAQALNFIYQHDNYSDPEEAPRPGLVLLDLNMPGVDGRSVLKTIKDDQKLKDIPVVVWTTSNNEQDIKLCYMFGANSYIIKPVDLKKLIEHMENIKSYWLETVTLPPFL